MKIPWIVYLIPFLFIFVPTLWVDPDATAMFNTACNGSDSDVPALSLFVFKLLPCDVLAWKIFQFLMIALILYLFQRSGLSLPLLGFVGYALVFFLSLEDDLLAFPFLLWYFVWAHRKLSPKTVLSSSPFGLESIRLLVRDLRHSLAPALSPGEILTVLYLRFGSKLKVLLVGVLLTFFLGSFVWKGAFLVGGILLSYFFSPILGLLLPLHYSFLGLGDNWGGSAEKIFGSGFFIGQIGLFILLVDWARNDYKWRNEYWLLIAFEILAFFEPKWGEWIVLPLLLLLTDQVKDVRLKVVGSWLFLLIIGFTVLTSFPSQAQIGLIQEAVFLQKEGSVVLNDWGVGHYVEFFGGVASQKGSSKGYQDVKGSYWLGPPILACDINRVVDGLALQQC